MKIKKYSSTGFVIQSELGIYIKKEGGMTRKRHNPN